jgi:hypothetical protein
MTATGSPSMLPTATSRASPSTTPTPTPVPEGEAWGYKNLFTYYDEDFLEFYIMGELVNQSGSAQRVMTFWPVVLDADGNQVTDRDDVDAAASGYKELREGVGLPAGSSLPFSFLIDVPQDVTVDDNYDFVIIGEPAEPARDDLDIPFDDYDLVDWPNFFYVEGSYDNPGPGLTEYVAIVVTLYDEQERVIGIGWIYSTDSSLLAAGEHDFDLEIVPWDIVEWLELEVNTYKIQVFGY